MCDYIINKLQKKKKGRKEEKAVSYSLIFCAELNSLRTTDHVAIPTPNPLHTEVQPKKSRSGALVGSWFVPWRLEGRGAEVLRTLMKILCPKSLSKSFHAAELKKGRGCRERAHSQTRTSASRRDSKRLTGTCPIFPKNLGCV